jgi:hypothetical protein
MGHLLSEQKAGLKHGEFIPWVKANLPFAERTARNYMRCHRERDRLKTATVADLKSVYRLLAKPKLAEQADEERVTKTELTEDEIIQEAIKIRKRRGIEAKETRDRQIKEFKASFKNTPTILGPPAQREKQAFYNKIGDTCLVCLAFGPDIDHPYLETADFEIGQEDFESIPKKTKPAKVFDIVLQLHDENKAVCIAVGTWGDYYNPKTDIGLADHFINYSKGNKPAWFKSGLEHGLPETAFKTDLRILDWDFCKVLYDHPPMPDEWDYDESVKKATRLISKRRKLSAEILSNVTVAKDNGVSVSKYCRENGFDYKEIKNSLNAEWQA